MNERNSSTKLNRRELFKRAALVTGGVVFSGSVIGLTVETMASVERQERQDHYKGIPFDEYASGTFTLVVGNYSDAKNTIVSEDPFVDPASKINTSKIESINGKAVEGEFFLTNPGVVRGINPVTNEENAPWMVVQAGLVKPGREFFSGSEITELLYVFLGKDQADGAPVEFCPVQMNAQGIHVDEATRRPVPYMGSISFDPSSAFFSGLSP